MNRRDLFKTVLGTFVFVTAQKTFAKTHQDILQGFQRRYRGARSISCAFAEERGIKGTLVAQKGGSYRVEMNDRTIVCNGTSVWSATTSARTVIINRFSASSTDLSLEKIFLEIMNVYQCTVLEQRSEGGRIRLTPPDSRTVIAGVTVADITLDASFRATRMIITQNGTTQTFGISKTVINGKLPKDCFTYHPPRGWEVVDLR